MIVVVGKIPVARLIIFADRDATWFIGSIRVGAVEQQAMEEQNRTRRRFDINDVLLTKILLDEIGQAASRK